MPGTACWDHMNCGKENQCPAYPERGFDCWAVPVLCAEGKSKAATAIKSVIVFIEHFEEERFVEGRLEWSIGTGWPNKPEVWAAISAPIHRGESNENVDSWDVTSAVDSVEKIKSLQLHVKNNSYSYKSKTLMDYAYVVVEYD